MNFTAFRALVWKDLVLFFTDRRAWLMSLAAPLAIASFFGFIFAGQSRRSDQARIPVHIADLDASAVSKAVVERLSKDPALAVTLASLDQAREAVRSGSSRAAAILPKDFGANSGRAFFRGGDKPEIQLLYDPSRLAERQMIEGILTGHIMQTVSKEMFSGDSGRDRVREAIAELEQARGLNRADRNALLSLLRSVDQWQSRASSQGANTGAAPGLSVPYQIKTEAVTAKPGLQYNPFAQAFAGMGVQFILFLGIEAGVSILLQKQRGLWKRFRAAPISRTLLLGARATSSAILALFILSVMFAFARAVFGVRMEGSLAGFFAVGLAFALMTATFGLLIAALGRTPEATRPLAILIVLILVMLGGSWMPAFLFPGWLQTATLIVPTRWAVDGLNAVTWRGYGFASALLPAGVLLLYAAGFGYVALRRFRWDQ